MKIVIRCFLVSAVALFSACASTPKSTMLVPSRTTVIELEKLSHQAGTTVDVLTVSRQERYVRLNGSGGGALSGRDLNESAALAGSQPVVRIPFTELALIYYSEDMWPVKKVYPSPPEVGPAEHGVSCDELDLDLARAETVRWYARRQGALPFAGHEQGALNAKKALKGVGETVWVLLEMYGGYSGGGGGGGHGDASLNAYRSVVTAADRRIIGLLELKRDRSCTPRDTRVPGETDLMVLGKIGEARQALVAKSITDQEQVHRETLLLDQFDPVLPGTVQSDFAAAVLTFGGVAWYPNVDATESLKNIVGKPLWLGAITLTDEELVFRPTSGNGAPMGEVVRLRYADLSGDFVTAHYGFRAVVGVTRRDGHKDAFEIDKNFGVDHKAMQAVVEFVKARMPTVTH